MTDFRINRAVWLHNRAYKPGQEERLERDGFTDEQKSEQARRGAITFTASSAVDATDAARELAETEGIDLTAIEGTGSEGRITKSDVEAAS